MVLAVKGSDNTVTYSFINMSSLLDIYKARAEDKDASTIVTVDGYEIEVKVNISATENNALVLRDDGLYVPPTAVTGTAGQLAAYGDDGTIGDSGIIAANVLTSDDVSDYTAEEISALLA